MRAVPFVGFAFLSLSFAACAAVHRPPTTVIALQAQDVPHARTARRHTVDALIDDLARRAAARGDHAVDLLLLSGGGQNGAYGAGFLRGWKSRDDAPMPTFDLVTGVSTGALQAPFAFLGTAARLAQSSEQYRTAADTSAPQLDWLFWARRTGGVADVERYQANIAKTVDERMQQELEAEFANHRHLVITSTDMDLGTVAVWDLAHELHVGGRPRAHSLFFASSAIPAVFPSIVLDGHVHSDGGIVANVHSPFDFDDYRAVAERMRSLGVSDPIDVRVWIVMNTWLDPKLRVIDPASRGDLRDRATEVMFMAHQRGVLDRIVDLGRAVSSQIPGLRMTVRATALPGTMANEPGASKLFDKDWMQRLEAYGYERARSADPWDGLVETAPR